MKNNILKHLLLCLFCLCATTTALAQRRISGTVSDDFDVIPGANVVEIDKNNRIVQGTVTDMNGNFTMQIKSDKDFLRVTFLGLMDFKEVIGNRSVFKIKLKENSKQLTEVVKTAKRKVQSGGLSIPQREMTGASQTFSMDEMEGLAFESVDQALQGQIAGLDIVANSGNLGAGTTMRIRGVTTINGNAQPLIVVDDHIFELPDDVRDNVNWEDMDNEEMFSTLLNVNTDDIESINVLKDAASAAKWGVKGSAGVIEIKLKRGKRGPTHVNFSYKFTGTWQRDGYKMLDGDSYTMMLKESYFNPTRQEKEFPELDYNMTYPDVYYNFNKNTDWVKAVTQFGQQHQYYLNISGGGEKATFRISAGYNTSKGSVIGQKMNQLTTATTLDYNVSERITFKSTVTMTFTTNYKNNTNDILARAYKAMPNMSIYEYGYNAETGDYRETGNYFNMLSPIGVTGSTTDPRLSDMFVNGNPVARAMGAWNKEYQYNLTPQFSIDYKFLGKDDEHTQLNYRGDVQLKIFNTSNDLYEPAELRTLPWYYNHGHDSYSMNGTSVTNTRNTLGNSEYKSLAFTTRHELMFYPKFENEDHFLAVLGRFDLETGSSTSQGLNLWNAPTGITDPTVAALPTNVYVSNNQWRSHGFYFNAHYSYKSRYVINTGVRIDGSTQFGAGNKYAAFPQVSLRWNIIDEPFMKWARPVISMFSIAPSWGMTGLTAGGGDSQYNKYTPGSAYLGHDTFYPENLSLTNIKWETTHKWNLRSNIAFFNDLITLDLDLYKNITKDLVMYNMRIPSSNGYAALSAVNAGQMSNKGWELYINTGKFCKVGKFSMKLKANFAQNFNCLDSMDDLLLSSLNGDKNLSLSNGGYDAMKRVQVGKALGSIFGLRYKGVYTYDYAHNGYTYESQHAYGVSANGTGYNENGAIINTYQAAQQRGVEGVTCPIAYDAEGNMMTDKYGNPLQMYFQYQDGTKYKFEGGDAIYEDVNHDGQIDRYDVVYLGNSNPKLNGGFGISLYFDRFSLNANFMYRVGNQIINLQRSNLESMNSNNNQSFATTWRWRKNGDITTIPRALMGTGYNSLPSDRYVEDGDFLRFSYLQLTYDFDAKLLKKIGVNSLKLSASANNLFVWSKYTGVDPEIAPTGFGIASDGGKTPRPLSFTVNLNLSF